MEEHRLPCRVLYCYIDGKGSRGRDLDGQHKRRLENQEFESRTATDLIRDRTRWRILV